MDTKFWWQSRTLWVQIVAGVFALLGALKLLPPGLDQEQVVSLVMVLVAITTGALRLNTTAVIAPAPAAKGGDGLAADPFPEAGSSIPVGSAPLPPDES